MHNTKKVQLRKLKNNSNRGFSGFNTGTRTMKSPKDYERMTPSEVEKQYIRSESEYEL